MGTVAQEVDFVVGCSNPAVVTAVDLQMGKGRCAKDGSGMELGQNGWRTKGEKTG